MTPPSPQLALVMPLFNEAEGVSSTVSRLVAALSQASIPYQLILVNNGSTDQTQDQLEALAHTLPGLTLLQLPRNLGYGGGILAGMTLAQAPILGYLWGDEQVAPYVLLKLFHLLTSNAFDMAKVVRTVRLEGPHRQAITHLYHALMPRVFPTLKSLRDLHGCPKLFTQSAWRALAPVSSDWFLDAEIMLKAQTLGLRLGEIDVVSWPRASGRSKVRTSTLNEFAWNILRHRLKGH